MIFVFNLILQYFVNNYYTRSTNVTSARTHAITIIRVKLLNTEKKFRNRISNYTKINKIQNNN
jgi:hypothetical protein